MTFFRKRAYYAAMTKSEAIELFGDSSTPQAAKIALMAEALGISRTAIYMWEEESIPELRELQIEKIVAARRALPSESQAQAAR